MARIHAASFARGWSEAELTTLLANPANHAVTTEHGFAILQILPPEAELLTVVIDPAFRGRGHGKALLAKALGAASDAGARRVFLEVEAANIAARSLYSRAGFTRTGTRHGYYAGADGTRSDAVVLSCDPRAAERHG